METTNTQRTLNRTLAVIEGGIKRNVTLPTYPTTTKPKLLDQVRQAIHARHYSPKTEESYGHWIKDSFSFNSKRHPAEMGEREIAQFLSSVTSELRVSASTQNQALNAIFFSLPSRNAKRDRVCRQ